MIAEWFIENDLRAKKGTHAYAQFDCTSSTHTPMACTRARTLICAGLRVPYTFFDVSLVSAKYRTVEEETLFEQFWKFSGRTTTHVPEMSTLFMQIRSQVGSGALLLL